MQLTLVDCLQVGYGKIRDQNSFPGIVASERAVRYRNTRKVLRFIAPESPMNRRPRSKPLASARQWKLAGALTISSDDARSGQL